MKKIIIIGVAVLLVGCGTKMATVMSNCDQGQRFDSYAICIRSTYDKSGRDPRAPIVRAFYADLDAISESYRNGQISNAQAKSLTYQAYSRTIEAANERSSAAALSYFGAMQTQQQLQQIQQQQRTPVTTTCNKFGNQVNCTSQ
jgi:hypothetical protein